MADITEYNIQIKFTESGAEKTAKDIDKVKSSTDKLKSAIKGIGIAAILKKSTDAIGGFINKTSDYIETVNLFRASMGSAADKAQEFIDKAEQMLGLDPKSMMDSISSFQNLSESLGISSDRAYLMSQNLTQLAGDLSSFANISFEQAQKKLLSGFSGQIKPLREYGIALDQASLQETAYSLGLDQKVRNMTQAQKAELRYYQIMTSTQKVQGDLGRSLLSPANALRVMKTEFQRLARAIGSIFIPIMMKIIPVVRAVTQLLIEAAQAIAKFFGFEMGNFEADLSSVGNMLEGVSDGIGDIGDEADSTAGKLNKMLMPFDELNNITSSTGTGGAGGLGGVGGGGDLGLNLPEYDMFDSITGGMSEKIENIKQKIKDILPLLGGIGAILAGWKISNTVIDIFDKIFDLSDGTKAKALEIAMGLTLIITGITLYSGSFKKILQGDLSVTNLLTGLFGAGATGAGVGLVAKGLGLAAAGPIGLAITLALTVLIASTYAWNKENEIQKKIAEITGFDWDGANFVQKFNFAVEGRMQLFGFKDVDPNSEWGKTVEGARENQPLLKLPATLLPGTLTGTLTALKQNWRDIKDFLFYEMPGDIELFKTKISEKFELAWTGVKIVFSNIGKWFTEDLPKTIDTWISTIINTVKNKFGISNDGESTEFHGIGENVVAGLTGGIVSKWDTFWNAIAGEDGFFTKFINKVKEKFGIQSPSTVFEGIGENLIQGLINGIENIWGTLTSKFDNIKNLTNFEWHLPSLKVPHMYWSTQPAPAWAAKVLSALNLPTNVPKLNLEWVTRYAQGGFPETGQLFVANEAGPELIGNIGNRTAVANQDQITTAIANATYQAMSRALAENGQNDGQPIIVNVGNEQLYKGMTNYRNQQSNMYGINL